MKTFISFCLLMAGVASVLPEKLESTLSNGIKQKNERLITGSIVQGIEELKQDIIEAGLDPYIIGRKSFEFALPVPVLLSVESVIEDICIKGLSNIVIHNINYNILFNRLTFDIRLPGIYISIGNASNDLTVLGSNLKSSVSGNVAIIAIRLRGNIRFSIGIISGISIRSVEINFDLGDIVSKIKIVRNGQDVSKPVNQLIGEIIPEKLKEFSEDIDELLTIIVKELIEANL